MALNKLGVIIFMLVGCNDSPKEIVPAAQDPFIEKLSLTSLDGKPFNLEQLRGKTVFLNFWASWCKPCIEEMPSIVNAEKVLSKEEVIFLLASGEDLTEIADFTSQRKDSLKYLRINNSEELGIQALPTTFILNSKGELVFSEAGYRKWDDASNINLILKIKNIK